MRQASELSGVSQEYRAYRAQLAQQLGEHGIALNDYQILLNEQPESARWWLGFAIASEQLGISTQALDAYQRVVRLGQLGPDVDAFARQRAELLVGRNESAEAVKTGRVCSFNKVSSLMTS